MFFHEYSGSLKQFVGISNNSMIIDSIGLKIARVILWLMMPALLIDALNGWLIREVPSAVSISQLYRISVMSLIFIWLARHSRDGWLILSGGFFILLACVSYHSFFYSQNSWLVLDLHFQLRLMLHFIFFIFLKTYINIIAKHEMRRTRFNSYVHSLFWFSYVVIAANIVAGVMGVGYSTVAQFAGKEEDAFGGLGFFKAGNDVGSTFVVIAGVAMFWTWTRSKKIGKYIFLGVVSLLLAVLLQTKTVIAGILIMWTAIPLVCSGLVLPNLRVRKKPLMIVLLVLTALISLLSWLVSAEMGIVKKFLYFYSQQGLLFAVLTGRDYFAGMAIQLITSSYSLGDLLFGRGWSLYLQGMANLYDGREKLVEIDYFDVFMIDGLVGLILQGAFWLFYLAQAYIGSRHSSVARSVLFIDLLLLGIAGTAGHVLYSTLNSMFIALLNTLPLLERAMVAGQTSVPNVEIDDATICPSGK